MRNFMDFGNGHAPRAGLLWLAPLAAAGSWSVAAAGPTTITFPPPPAAEAIATEVTNPFQEDMSGDGVLDTDRDGDGCTDNVDTDSDGVHDANLAGDGLEDRPVERIKTYIESVTFDDPVHVEEGSLKYFQVSGSIEGTGWGGTAAVLRTPSMALYEDDTLDLEFHFNPLADDVYVMAYAWVYVENVTGAALPVVLGLASDDSIAVLLNGVAEYAHGVAREIGPGGTIQDRIPLTLEAGMNLLTFKVFEGEGWWGMRARLEDPITGNPLRSGEGQIVVGTPQPAGETHPEGFFSQYLVWGPIPNPFGAVPPDGYLSADWLAYFTWWAGSENFVVPVEGDGFLVYLPDPFQPMWTEWIPILKFAATPPKASELRAHYHYRTPFVLRWPSGWNAHLVAYAHGSVDPTYAKSLYELFPGWADPEVFGRKQISDAAVVTKYAYFHASAHGSQRDGSFCAGYLTNEVAPLVHEEVMYFLRNDFTGEVLQGVAAGDPVPCAFEGDVSTFRNNLRVAWLLLDRLTRKKVRQTIGVGLSGGAGLVESVVGGREWRSSRRGTYPRTGGNFLIPYQAGTRLLLDGAIAVGHFLDDGRSIDFEFPHTAPVCIVQGESDPSFLSELRYARALHDRGVALRRNLAIYQVRNISHIFREAAEEFADFIPSVPKDGDRLAPVLVALVEGLSDLAAKGQPLPRSRIDGRRVPDSIDRDGDGALEDQLFFDLSDGSATDQVPFLDDPRIDTMDLWRREVTPEELEAWSVVMEQLDPLPSAVSLPGVSCRTGGFDILGFYTMFRPFPTGSESRTAEEVWGNSGSYIACVTGILNDLAKEGLYERKLGEQPH